MVTLDEGFAVEIKKLEAPLLVSLRSVPQAGAASPDSVLAELRTLPEPEGEAPYLEVKVLLDEPEPMLRQQIEEVLAGKHYRLARIVSVYRKGEDLSTSEEETVVGLKEMSPLQIAQSTFERTYQTEMPAELVGLFREVCLTLALNEEEEA